MSKKVSIIATGDSFMTRRIPENGYLGFQELVEIIGQYEVKFNNLEITIHNQQGYPAAVSGGTWAMAGVEILEDLNRYGFNLYNTANNHSCDYSCGGVVATSDNLKRCGKVFAGTGATLQEASAPGYLKVNDVCVALLGACSSCDASAVAGNANSKIIGRPGLNPLRFVNTYHVEPKYFSVLQEIAENTCINAEQEKGIANGYYNPMPEGKLSFGKNLFVLSDHNGRTSEPLDKDMHRMEENIRIAKEKADCVLVSIHSHECDGRDDIPPADFLRIFAHKCIDAGADAILGHGPHELRGIEIYKGKPIFYSLGNFVFQTETVSAQPADAFENKGLDIEMAVEEYMDNRSKNGTRGYCVQENIWRSVMAGFTLEDGVIQEITLYPITLDMHLPRKEMGSPRLAEDNSVLSYLQTLCEPFGTKLEIRENNAIIKLRDSFV